MGHEQPARVKPRRHVEQCLPRRRRQDDDPLLAVFRQLQSARAVEVAADMHLVVHQVAAFQRKELARSQADLASEQDHRPKRRPALTVNT